MASTVRTIQATPEAIFAVLADGWLYPTWVVGASRMRHVDEGWPAPGARLHHSFGVWPALLNDNTELLEWDPPRRAVLEARGWPAGTATVELVAESIGTGTQVRITENAAHGPAAMVPKSVWDAAVHVRNGETLRRLAYLAEGGAG